MSEKNTRLFFSINFILILTLVPVLQALPLNLPPLLPEASAQSGIGNIYISNVQHNSTTVSSPYKITISNFNVGTGTSRLLVVGVEADNQPVNSVTFTVGSETFNLMKVAESFYSEYTAFWYLKNPTGTGTITVTMAGSTSVVVGAYALQGVDQADPIPTTATNHTAIAPVSKNPNISLTTEFPNSVVLDSAATYGGGTLSGTGCGHSEWDVTVSNTTITGASSNTTKTSAGTVTCKWTNSATNGWDDAAIEIKAAGDAPQASPIILNGKSTASGVVNSPYQVTLYNFSAGTGPNRLLLVGIEANNQSATSVTFGGVALTQKVSSFNNNDAEFWYLKNPSSNPKNIVVTFGGSTAFVVGAYSFFDVNQTTPIPTTKTNSSSSGNLTISLTTADPNDLVIDSPSIYGGSMLSSPTCLQEWDSNAPITSTSKITGASSITLVPVSSTTVSCKWTNSISTNAWDDVAVELKAVSLTASTGILMPLYCAPYSNDSSNCADGDTYSWQPVYSAHKAHPKVPFFAIYNPASGPGSAYPTCDGTRTDDDNRGIANLTSSGIPVLGYVDTNFTRTPYSTAVENITAWVACYPKISGIFFDEMNYPTSGVTTSNEIYYQNLTSYAKNTKGLTYTIGNPGSPTGQNYVNSGAADVIDIFEQSNVPSIPNDLVPDTFANLFGVNYGYDKHDFSFLSYGQSALPSSPTVSKELDNQSNYVGLMFYSNTTTSTNQWARIPTYLSTETAVLDNLTSVITINSTGPSGPVTGLLVQISQNGTVVPSGYTPYSYLGTQGVTYTFTPQGSTACTFDHWKDTSSTTAARAITVTSSSKAYTAVYNGTSCK